MISFIARSPSFWAIVILALAVYGMTSGAGLVGNPLLAQLLQAAITLPKIKIGG